MSDSGGYVKQQLFSQSMSITCSEQHTPRTTDSSYCQLLYICVNAPSHKTWPCSHFINFSPPQSKNSSLQKSCTCVSIVWTIVSAASAHYLWLKTFTFFMSHVKDKERRQSGLHSDDDRKSLMMGHWNYKPLHVSVLVIYIYISVHSGLILYLSSSL